MSRIGKNPVPVPDGVQVDIAGQVVTAKGKLGERSVTLVDEVEVARDEAAIVVKPRGTSKRARTMWGTSRSLLDNLVKGVSEGFTIDLELIGVGYRAAVAGQTLNLQLGYSHDIAFPIPEGIDIKCERPTAIRVHGADKQRVGQVAAEIRRYRPPEPYKGKGVKYANENVLRKEGKKK